MLVIRRIFTDRRAVRVIPVADPALRHRPRKMPRHPRMQRIAHPVQFPLQLIPLIVLIRDQLIVADPIPVNRHLHPIADGIQRVCRRVIIHRRHVIERIAPRLFNQPIVRVVFPIDRGFAGICGIGAQIIQDDPFRCSRPESFTILSIFLSKLSSSVDFF